MGAGIETGLQQGMMPRSSQVLEGCELLDGTNVHTGTEEEERQDSWVFF